MWEVLFKRPRGRLSLRNFSFLATSLLMAIFLILGPISNPALAVDAERSGQTVKYEDRSYNRIDKYASPPQLPTGLPSNTDGYAYFDDTGKKAYFLLTQDSLQDAKSLLYITYQMNSPGNFTDPSSSQTIKLIEAPADAESATQNGGGTGCNSEYTSGIGWILCPTVNFLAKGMDFIYKVVSDFLEVKTITNDQSSLMYRLWAVIRDIANLCFFIALIIIVYATITSQGVSNYNLKKILPKMLIAAIFINLSYIICAAAVDISNILGRSIYDIFMSLVANMNTTEAYKDVTVPQWTAVAGALIGGGALFLKGAPLFILYGPGVIFLFAAALLPVIFAALLALAVLAIRQALLAVLIIISPLAFVAMLLPNTEKYFDKWRQLFMTLLLLFPIFSVIFSGAQVASIAIIASAGDNIVTIILGMVVQVAPIVVTPILIKFSGGLVGRIAGMVNDRNHGFIDKAKAWNMARADEEKNKILTDKQRYLRSEKLGNLAKKIDERRRRGDGRRKAYESLADARFANTESGQSIAALEKEAGNSRLKAENTFADSDTGRYLEMQSRNYSVNKQEIDNSLMDSTSGHDLRTRQRNADTEKQSVENRYMQTNGWSESEAASRRIHIKKDDLENDFEDSTVGHQVDRAKRKVEQRKTKIGLHHEKSWNNALLTDNAIRQTDSDIRELKADVEIGQQEVTNVFDTSSAGRRVDQAKRDVERVKQTVAAELEQAWHFRNQTDAASQEREMRLRIATDDSNIAKTKVDNIHGSLKLGDTSDLVTSMNASTKQQLADAAHIAALDTKRVETQKIIVDNTAKKQWEKLSRTDDATRNLRLQAEQSADTLKVQEERTKTMVANVRAEGSSAPGLSAADHKVAEAIRHTNQHTRIEIEKQANAKIVEDNAYLEMLNNQTTQLEAGGIRGAEGAKTVYAKTIAASRKEFGDRVSEMAQLKKQFNPNASERQDIVMGISRTVEQVDSSGKRTSYTFDASDPYVMEAFISAQFSEGSAKEKLAIVDSAGNGNVNFSYRTSIRDEMASKGLAKQFFWLGGKYIDIVGQGKYTSDQQNSAMIYHISDGKISTDMLATQDAYSIQQLLALESSTEVAALGTAERAKFDRMMTRLKHTAWEVVHDTQLKAVTSDATLEQLEMLMVPPSATS